MRTSTTSTPMHRTPRSGSSWRRRRGRTRLSGITCSSCTGSTPGAWRNLARMQEDGGLDTAVDAEAVAYALGVTAQRLAYLAASDDSLDREALLHALTTVWLRALRRD